MTQSACEAKVREEWSDDINEWECRGGVVQKELDECVSEIKDESCGSPLDSLSRMVACRESDICKALSMR
jgi:hypothetical protein